MPSNTKYYLCQYFRFRLLFKAFVLSLAEKCSITIYYTIENGASRFIEKWNKPITRLFSKFVSVESFPFDVSQMKLEDGRTVMETCYYGTLYKFVEAAEETCLRGEKSLLKRLNKKLVANEDDIKFCIKHYFSFSIINQLLLVDLASWLLKNESSPLLGKEVGVIIDRKNYGTSFLLEYINEQKLNFMTVRTVRKLNENLIFVFVYHLTNLIVSCFTQNGKEKTDTDSPAKMCTYHYGDYGFSDFKNKRNYSLFWYPDSGIKPEEMIIFSQKTDEINEPDILKAQEQGFQLIACDGFKRTRNKLVKRHKCSITSLGNLGRF